MENIYQKFGKYYDQIYHSMFDPRMDCDILESLFDKFCRGKPTRILDIGCGTGSHAIELAKRGYKLAGIDLSQVMIEEAKRKADEAKLEVDFQVQDMRYLESNAKFDAAICMFGTFGYLVTNEDLNGFLSGLKNVLDDPSPFLFEFWNTGGVKPESVKQGFKTWVKAKDEKAGITLVRLGESKFDVNTNILTVNMEFFVFKGSKVLDSFTEIHELRCFNIPEIKQILLGNGFNLVATYDKDVQKPTLESPLDNTFRILGIARTR